MDPLASLTGIAGVTTTTTTSFFMLPGAASQRLAPQAADPMMMMMMAQQQQMTNLLLSLMGMMLGLMAGSARAGGAAGLGQASGASSGTGSGGATGGSASGGAAGGVGPNVPTGAPTEKVGRFIEIAKAQQGDPYVFGATGPDKFDCSGLVYYALKNAGVPIGRMTADGYMQHYRNSRVDRANLKPGDLIFFHSRNSRGIPPGRASHVEIYLGNGMSMGTDNPGEGARIEPVNWDSFIGGARVPELYS